VASVWLLLLEERREIEKKLNQRISLTFSMKHTPQNEEERTSQKQQSFDQK
jgi:hypothetical protein